MLRFVSPSIHGVVSIKAYANVFWSNAEMHCSIRLNFGDIGSDEMVIYLPGDRIEYAKALVTAINKVKADFPVLAMEAA